MAEQSIHEATEALVAAIRQSEEYTAYKQLKGEVLQNETTNALLKEYQRMQTTLQMAAVAGKETSDEGVQKFSQLSALLYTNQEAAQYLMAQLRLQKLAGDVFQRVADAAELDFQLPGM